jgi:hypothetical protein
MSVRASNWRALQKNTLRGFVDLSLQPSGLVLRECSVHRTDAGRMWIGLPGKPQIDGEGRLRRDQNDKALYAAVVDFTDKPARERFQTAALEAVEALLDGEPP